MVGSALKMRAGSKRRKPPRRWKTVEAERGRTVALSVPKRRQRCCGGSGLFGSGRRRGDLWKTLGEASGRRPQGTVGGEDGNVGIGDAKHTRVRIPTQKVWIYPVKGP